MIRGFSRDSAPVANIYTRRDDHENDQACQNHLASVRGIPGRPEGSNQRKDLSKYQSIIQLYGSYLESYWPGHDGEYDKITKAGGTYCGTFGPEDAIEASSSTSSLPTSARRTRQRAFGGRCRTICSTSGRRRRRTRSAPSLSTSFFPSGRFFAQFVNTDEPPVEELLPPGEKPVVQAYIEKYIWLVKHRQPQLGRAPPPGGWKPGPSSVA